MNDKWDELIEEASSIERKMNIYDLDNDIIDILLKYSKGTEIQNLTVKEFSKLSNMIQLLITKPLKYLNK